MRYIYMIQLFSTKREKIANEMNENKNQEKTCAIDPNEKEKQWRATAGAAVET